MTSDRRRAAILAADMVGYSRMMEADEDGVVAALRRLRAEVIDPALAAEAGRLVKTMGDGLLAEFADPAAAARAAMAVQGEITARGAAAPPERRIAFRIGLHAGEVIAEGDDILGDGVNLAARLEGLAEPGGVAASAELVSALDDPALAAAFADAGEHRVKNLTRPVRVWRWRAKGAPDDLPGEDRAGRRLAIAVLPFENLSRDPDQEFFADGLTEDIIAALSYTRRIPVISGASSATFKGRGASAPEAARALGARYLLEGTVRRAGGRVRVTVQLVEGENGRHLWAEKFDRPLDDVFEIQDEITLRVVTAIEPELTDEEIRRSRAKRPGQLTAWEHFLRGMTEFLKWEGENMRAAREHFEAALAIDPDYAEAWSGLAWTHLREFASRAVPDPGASLDKGYEAARRAVGLDDGSAFAHYVLSTAYVWRGEPALSMAELEHALRLNPYYVRARMAHGNRLELNEGRDPARAAEGVAEMRAALELSPRDPDRFRYFAAISRALAVQGDHQGALDWIERAVSVRPRDPDILYRRAIALAHLDRVEDARAALADCERLRPGYLEERRAWRPYDDDARNDAYFGGLRRHGLV